MEKQKKGKTKLAKEQIDLTQSWGQLIEQNGGCLDIGQIWKK